MLDTSSAIFRSDESDTGFGPDSVQRSNWPETPHTHVTDHHPGGDAPQRYRPSSRARWTGWAVTLAIYAVIGSSGIFMTVTLHQPPIKQAPALTIVELQPQEPPLPSPEVQDRIEPSRQTPRPAAIHLPALPDIPSPLLLPPSLPELPLVARDGKADSMEAAPSPSDAQSSRKDGPDSWEGRILAALNDHRRYPRAAIWRHEQGTPTISFVMNRKGQIVSSRLDQSSGYADLDREAVALPARAAPLPSPPDDRPGNTLELIVPIEFYLR